MAIFKRSSHSSDGTSPHHDKEANYTTAVDVPAVGSDGVVEYGDHNHLHRGLKSRHITMIAIGGAIGTGLIIGTGKALAQSGYDIENLSVGLY